MICTALYSSTVSYPVHCKITVSLSGVVDSSGLRLFYTPELRQYDAGVIETGVWVSLYHMLPPGMQEYVSEGHCTRECLQEVKQPALAVFFNLVRCQKSHFTREQQESNIHLLNYCYARSPTVTSLCERISLCSSISP